MVSLTSAFLLSCVLIIPAAAELPVAVHSGACGDTSNDEVAMLQTAVKVKAAKGVETRTSSSSASQVDEQATSAIPSRSRTASNENKPERSLYDVGTEEDIWNSAAAAFDVIDDIMEVSEKERENIASKQVKGILDEAWAASHPSSSWMR
eukprot:gnl/TRDRNA2_/TRDRNA2_185866_c0_seq1.p1 gnl/TRDRNA2_/TRDRNA2_185866_c0~~gnl/TRDRNA2_/TRDRNA2_185866_c0_seq1.p1  ORF type:complete len:150 (+),score=33.43 gnl/TRDRNA2_/TRDRNA2_185866_c0_seq1:79-528(+)